MIQVKLKYHEWSLSKGSWGLKEDEIYIIKISQIWGKVAGMCSLLLNLFSEQEVIGSYALCLMILSGNKEL